MYGWRIVPPKVVLLPYPFYSPNAPRVRAAASERPIHGSLDTGPRPQTSNLKETYQAA